MALQAIIENDLRQKGTIPGFDARRFDHVIRHAPVANADGTKTQTAPNLIFRIRQDREPSLVLSEHDGIFIECKPVDAKHPVRSDYCQKGLRRFDTGDYAWAMQDALMVGYSSGGRTVAGHLLPVMEEDDIREGLHVLQLPQAVLNPEATTRSDTEILYHSLHQRAFDWPDGKGTAVDILVYHSWHRCD